MGQLAADFVYAALAFTAFGTTAVKYVRPASSAVDMSTARVPTPHRDGGACQRRFGSTSSSSSSSGGDSSALFNSDAVG
eukprot:scaffold1847_cov343-Prasinococcus_capsulatus_cf.AAC.14